MGKDSRRRSRSRSGSHERRYRQERSSDGERSSGGERRRSRPEQTRSDNRSSYSSRSYNARDGRPQSEASVGSGRQPPVREPAFRVEDYINTDNKEDAAKKLDDEMRKHKERIERWRMEKKAEVDVATLAASLKETANYRMWSLEDEADDDEEAAGSAAGGATTSAEEELPPPPPPPKNGPPQVAAAADDDDVDPLDAYMREVNTEVRQLQSKRGAKTITTSSTPQNSSANSSTAGEGGEAASSSSVQKTSKVVVVTRVIDDEQQQQQTSTSKGEYMEQNADAMEYSEEEAEQDMESLQASLANKPKQLPQVDHSKVFYRKFRKDFYVEVPELQRMTDEEVAAYREKLDGIHVKGKRCPKPVRSWAQCGCSKTNLELLKKNGFEKLTPIQAQAIPAIMSGRDVIGIAKTGSGKTLAFLLPMFRHIMDQESLDEMDGPIGLVMTPTRELAMQITKECRKFCKALNLNVVCVYGGAGISEQIAELKRGTEIIICTPGRMIDMLAANNGKVTNLRRVTYLVLDEADRMFDMGFEPQVMKIIGNIRTDRQTVMFSATFPRQMEALAKKALDHPIEIQVGGRSVVCNDVEQHAVVLDEEKKFLKLLELLGIYCEQGSVLVFVDKQEAADHLAEDLMHSGYMSCGALHAGIDQDDRGDTIRDFMTGKIRILVATSVAARGLDVKNLILVVNYDCPNHYEDYVHRVGRTGRAGKKGYAHTFILPSEQERRAGNIVRAFENAGVAVPEDLKQLWDAYKAKMEAEGKPVKTGGGYGGHGYRFDEFEVEAGKSKRKTEKLLHGLTGSDVEDEMDDLDEQLESIIKSSHRIKEAALAADVAINATYQGEAVQVVGQMNREALERASAFAHHINVARSIGVGAKVVTKQTAEMVMKGANAPAASVTRSTGKIIAQQLARRLNDRLNYTPSEKEAAPVDERPQYVKYEEEIEINDLPQQLRWKIMSRETIGQIQEYADCGIRVRGVFVQSGKQPPEGEKKLSLSIESLSEMSISKAKQEVMRVLKEEYRRLQSQAAMHNFNRGRYKVL